MVFAAVERVTRRGDAAPATRRGTEVGVSAGAVVVVLLLLALGAGYGIHRAVVASHEAVREGAREVARAYALLADDLFSDPRSAGDR